MPGAQLLTVRYAAAKRFAHDPSQIVTDIQCPREWWRPVAWALTRFPRDAFDYVWMIRPPQFDQRFLQGLVPLYIDDHSHSGLYRVDHNVPAPVIRPGELPLPKWERDLILNDGRQFTSNLPEPEASPSPVGE